MEIFFFKFDFYKQAYFLQRRFPEVGSRGKGFVCPTLLVLFAKNWPSLIAENEARCIDTTN